MIYAFFLLPLFLFATVNLQAATLHAILIGDSSRSDWLSSSQVGKDVENMRKTVDLIAQKSNMTAQISIMVGARIYHYALMKIIQSLDVKSDDVVILYFKGYGYRTLQKQGDFPYIYLGGDKQGVEFKKLSYEILEKGPRFYLGIADCTNYSLPNYLAPPIKKEIDSFASECKEKDALPFACDVTKGFEKLFLDYSGSILLGACAPESRYDYSYRDGGSFFKAFLQSLLYEVYSQELSDWNVLLTKMSTELYDMSEEFHQEMLVELKPRSISAPYP